MVITALPFDASAQVTPRSSKKRHPLRAALFCALLLVGSGALYSWQAWPETVRREAYLPELEKMSRASSYDGRLQALVGARQLEAGNYPAATSSLRQAIAAGEDDSSVWLNLAAALDANGERPRALANLSLALKNHPQDPQLRAALERTGHVPVGSPIGALAPAISPDGPRPIIAQLTQGSFLNGLSSWWGRAHPDDSGFTTRQTWAQSEPKNALAQRLWGEALQINERPREAETVLRGAVALAPRSVEAHIALAALQEQTAQNTAASLEYLAALRLQRENLNALLGFGRTSLNAMHVGQAVRAFSRATQIAPTSIEAWKGLGRAAQLTGAGDDQSVAAYQKAAQLAPDDTDFFNDYAVSLDKISRQAEAESLLRRRLKAAPQDALSHHLLGRELMNFNPTPARVAEAQTQTRMALKLNPGNPTSSIQLAQLLFQENQAPAETIALLKSAIGHDPFNRNSLLLLARVYRQNGQNDLADQTALRATQLFDNQQKIADLVDVLHNGHLSRSGRAQLARLYELTGQNAKARQQKTILALTQKDSQLADRVQNSYNTSVDQVLGAAKTSLEKE